MKKEKTEEEIKMEIKTKEIADGQRLKNLRRLATITLGNKTYSLFDL